MPIKYDVQRVRVKPDPITIIVTGSTGITGGTNLGAGEGIYNGVVNQNLTFKSLVEGNGVTIDDLGDELRINANLTGGTGFVTNDTFTGYTATTESRLEEIETDINYLSGQTAAKVASVNEGTGGISIDNSDPQNPIINFTGSSASDGVVSGGTLNGTVLELKRTQSLPDVDIELSGLTDQIIDDINYVSGQTDLKLNISDFNVYSGVTDSRLDNIENDVTYLSGQTSGNTQAILANTAYINAVSANTVTNANNIQAISASTSGLTNDYDYYDTTANILALPPASHTGQTWWSTDDKVEYVSKYVEPLSAATWIEQALKYDGITDTFKLGNTADGQTQNVGREVFKTCRNIGVSGATALNPKIYLATNVTAFNEEFIETICCFQPSDINSGSIYGINTTDVDDNGFFKMLMYGTANNVNTSAWTVGTILYAGENGLPTSIRPASDVHTIGVVTKQHATEGKIEINTIVSTKEDVQQIPAFFNRTYFTGEEVTGLTAGTFYSLLTNDEGTVAEVTQQAVVPDDSTVALGQDSITNEFTQGITIDPTFFDGQIETEINRSSNNERVEIEVYRTDSGGTVIDSGITGETVGDLGVRPLYVLRSALLNLQQSVRTQVYISGSLTEAVSFNQGDRIRTHILCSKVGSIGGNKTFTIYFGSDYDSFIRSPQTLGLNDLNDVTIVTPTNNEVLKYNSSTSQWENDNIVISDVTGLQAELNSKLNETVFTGYTATTEVRLEGIQNDITYLSGQTDLKADKSLNIVSITGASSLSESNNSDMIEGDGTFTITIPSGLTTGWNVSVTNVGSGTITIAAGGGATLQSKDSAVTIASQYSGAVIYHRGSNNILLAGDIS